MNVSAFLKKGQSLVGLMPTKNILLAYDLVLMRPACVLVAQMKGADTKVPHLFPVDSWLLSPTPDLKLYETSPEQLIKVIEKTEQAWRSAE